jgi:hypothetical protein
VWLKKAGKDEFTYWKLLAADRKNSRKLTIASSQSNGLPHSIRDRHFTGQQQNAIGKIRVHLIAGNGRDAFRHPVMIVIEFVICQEDATVTKPIVGKRFEPPDRCRQLAIMAITAAVNRGSVLQDDGRDGVQHDIGKTVTCDRHGRFMPQEQLTERRVGKSITEFGDTVRCQRTGLLDHRGGMPSHMLLLR